MVKEEEIEDRAGVEEVDEVHEPEVDDKSGDKPGEKDDKPKIDPEIKRLAKENKALLNRIRESDQAVGYWKGKADSAPSKPAEKAEVEDEEIDLVDLITTKGAKGLDELLAKRGYAKREDVVAEIAQTRGDITSEAAVLAKHADLANETSPLFLRTAAIWQQFKQDPHLAKSSKLMMIAADRAADELELEALRGGQRRPSKHAVDRDDEEIPDEGEEDERTQRVARQSGDRGRRPAERAAGSDELDDTQKSLVAKLRAAGADIDEKRYAARARAGVRVGGTPSHRRRA